MTRFAMLLATLVAIVPMSARAADVLTGKDAAYIDWAARNCGMRSTPKEHGLIDQAKAKGAAVFDKQYMQQYQDKALADALASPGKTKLMCEDIKSWYGGAGSRIDGLVQAVSDPSTATPSSAGAAARKGSDDSSGPRVGKMKR
jgi:hypothetical protein